MKSLKKILEDGVRDKEKYLEEIREAYRYGTGQYVSEVRKYDMKFKRLFLYLKSF